MRTSVIIASYNGEQYIKRQLESIAMQTITPSEIIVSDDGSTDNTVAVVNKFAEEHSNQNIDIRLIINKGEHGVTSNFENAVRHTTGDLIFFSDQDDVWKNDKIEKMLSVIQTFGVSVAFHNAYILLTDSNTGEETVKSEESLLDLSPYKYQFDAENSRMCRLKGAEYIYGSAFNGLVNGMCICAKKEWLLKTMPFSRGIYHDMWIIFCALADDTIAMTNECLAYYRIHSDNTSGLQKYRKKRKLFAKLSTFDIKGKESIIHQYLWYKDITGYVVGKPQYKNNIEDKFYHFFTDSRISILKKRKLQAIADLIAEQRKGSYVRDGNILFAHDLFYVLRYSSKTRKEFIDKLDDKLRISNL